MEMKLKTHRIPVTKPFQKETVDSVDQILTTQKENPEVGTSDLEAKIDWLVYEVSEEESGIVEGSVG